MSEYIAVNTPLLAGNEKKYLNECIDTGWISSEGPFVQQLENDMAKQSDRKFGVAVCNGTVALELAVKAIGIEPGDEVIMPAFTIISCALAVVRAGAIPVLVDSHVDTWNMDVNQIEAKITSKTKAIMAVHIYGLPVDMAPLMALAQKYNLLVIEDAAQMIGQTYQGKPCGSFGDISIFSFYPNKLVTTGEGGMLVTNDENIAEKAKLLRNLAFMPGRRYYHEEMGWNFRMSNLQAAVGVAQFEKLEQYVIKKREIGQQYNSLLADNEAIQLPISKADYAENIYWVYGILLKKCQHSVPELMQKLHKLGVGSRAFFCPMHQQPVFQNMGLFKNETYPNAEQLSEQGIYLPSGLALTPDNITQVCERFHTAIHAD